MSALNLWHVWPGSMWDSECIPGRQVHVSRWPVLLQPGVDVVPRSARDPRVGKKAVYY